MYSTNDCERKQTYKQVWLSLKQSNIGCQKADPSMAHIIPSGIVVCVVASYGKVWGSSLAECTPVKCDADYIIQKYEVTKCPVLYWTVSSIF